MYCARYNHMVLSKHEKNDGITNVIHATNICIHLSSIGYYS